MSHDLYAWVDASAGIAGDMLLGALLDAGADLAAVQAAVDAVVPQAVRVTVSPTTRAGLRASRVAVVAVEPDPPARTWRAVAGLLASAPADGLPEVVRDRAAAVFTRLAEAEARVHGIPAADVHFHEVGALDAIADVVGVCAALHDLGVRSAGAGEVALGSGTVRTAHGTLPVPVPAVVELAGGRRVRAGGPGELATPTGMALLSVLAERDEDLPSLRLRRTGVGAGSRDLPGRANVTRVLLGHLEPAPTAATGPTLLLEANVDDLDPRLWPGVLDALLAAGADDAWLVPILGKKGRPGHVVSLLCDAGRADGLRDHVLALTSTLGVRQTVAAKYALPRGWVDVLVDGEPVAVKVAYADGVIRQVSPEFDAVAARAAALGRAPYDVLIAATVAATAAGFVGGVPLPPRPLRPGPDARAE
ncbi:MAG: nickel pincer cofactor biosynthesis protein LarC [Actinomycetes bacterium]